MLFSFYAEKTRVIIVISEIKFFFKFTSFNIFSKVINSRFVVNIKTFLALLKKHIHSMAIRTRFP